MAVSLLRNNPERRLLNANNALAKALEERSDIEEKLQRAQIERSTALNGLKCSNAVTRPTMREAYILSGRIVTAIRDELDLATGQVVQCQSCDTV